MCMCKCACVCTSVVYECADDSVLWIVWAVSVGEVWCDAIVWCTVMWCEEDSVMRVVVVECGMGAGMWV